MKEPKFAKGSQFYPPRECLGSLMDKLRLLFKSFINFPYHQIDCSYLLHTVQCYELILKKGI